MTSGNASAVGSPPRRALMQPALPIVSITQPTGRAAKVPEEAMMQAAASIPDAKDQSEGPTASDDDIATDVTTPPFPGELLTVNPRRDFTLPRPASMVDLDTVRSEAGSRVSDHPRGSHSAVQSISIEDPFLSPEKPAQNVAVAALSPPEVDMSPRQDRIGQEITPANAQGHMIPAACVFMANLSSQRTLDQLVHSVEVAMEIYGKCWVKVQFDKNKMPYAFVQFEREEDARLCLTSGRSLIIDGRAIRVEHARAHRSVYLTKITGGPVTDEEARNVLGRFGPIEETCQTTLPDQELHGLPEGCWVKFRFFMDCKDAIASTRTNGHYRLVVKVPEESGHTMSNSPSLNRGNQRGQRYGSDAKAIFVGNLPETVTEELLHEAFKAYGAIISCKIVRKAQGNNLNIFAFIEFSSIAEAQAAKDAQLTVGNVPLRIEPKRYTMRHAHRNTSYNSSPIAYENTCYGTPYHSSPMFHGNDPRMQYNAGYQTAGSYTPVGFPANQPTYTLPIIGGPPAHAQMQYTQYPSPHYTSPLAPRGYEMMSSPTPMYQHGTGTAAPPAPPTYYAQYMVGSPMHPITEHEGENGGHGHGGF